MVNQYNQRYSFLRGRRWTISGGLLAIAGLALLVLLVLPDTIVLPALDVASLPRGEWQGDNPVFSYYEELNQISIAEQDGIALLRVKSDNSNTDLYNGFGVVGNFDVPLEATLSILWRGTVNGPSPSLHVIDGSPGRIRSDGGEVFTVLAPIVSNEWQLVRVPLRGFERDQEQPADAPTDGVLDSQGISNIEIGFAEGTVAEMEIREINFTWQVSRGPTYLVLILGGVVGLLLLFRTPGIRPSEGFLTLSSGIDSVATLFPLVSLCMAGAVLIDRHFSLSAIEALALGGMFVMLILDELLAPNLQRWAVWDLRYAILLSIVWWLGGGSKPLLLSALLLVGLLPAAMRGRRITLIGITLPILAVALQPPITEAAGKGNSLFFATIVAVLAVGISEIVRGSEIRQQHQITTMMYRGILEATGDGVVLVAPDGRIELSNRGCEYLLGANSGELLGHEITEYLTTLDGEALSLSTIPTDGRKIEAILSNPETTQHHEILVAAHLIQQHDLPERLQLIITDISDRKRMERELERANERLQRLASTDELTGIDNRRAFEEVLTNEWRRCCRSKLPITVLYCDIDAFKAYNDRFGHPAGDEVLRKVADVLAKQLRRPGDTLARYGGEEFVALLPGTDESCITGFVEKLRLAVEKLGIEHPGNPAASVVTISIGVASCVPSQDFGAQACVQNADSALYAAKENGRNRVVIHNGDKDVELTSD